jgi:hypothetical protein
MTETCSSISSIIVKLTYDSSVDGYKNLHHLIAHATGCKHPRLKKKKPTILTLRRRKLPPPLPLYEVSNDFTYSFCMPP